MRQWYWQCCRRLRVSGRGCPCLEQSATSCHLRSIFVCLLYPLEESPFQAVVFVTSTLVVPAQWLCHFSHFNRSCFFVVIVPFAPRAVAFSRSTAQPWFDYIPLRRFVTEDGVGTRSRDWHKRHGSRAGALPQPQLLAAEKCRAEDVGDSAVGASDRHRRENVDGWRRRRWTEQLSSDADRQHCWSWRWGDPTLSMLLLLL